MKMSSYSLFTNSVLFKRQPIAMAYNVIIYTYIFALDDTIYLFFNSAIVVHSLLSHRIAITNHNAIKVNWFEDWYASIVAQSIKYVKWMRWVTCPTGFLKPHAHTYIATNIFDVQIKFHWTARKRHQSTCFLFISHFIVSTRPRAIVHKVLNGMEPLSLCWLSTHSICMNTTTSILFGMKFHLISYTSTTHIELNGPLGMAMTTDLHDAYFDHFSLV